ncbi:MAG: ATP-binding cassette domain-containing protein [Bdellovibrionota bacterium]
MKESLLKILNASFQVPSIEKPILSKMEYEIFAGDFVIILGSNGSGKSTLLKLIDKRIKASSGKILLDGKDIYEYSKKQYSQKVKILTQDCHDSLFTSLTLYENYLLANSKKVPSHKKEREFLKDYLQQFNPKFSLKLDQVVNEFSGGEKQTLALALTILNPPLLLLLDEHTSALDPKTAELNMQLTKDMITRNGITCLLTTHNLNIAEHYGNRILALHHGEVLASIEQQEKHTLTNELMYKMFY